MWCHNCRVEYLEDLHACPECFGSLTTVAPPESRRANIGAHDLVVLATMPPEQALVAAGQLDATGIANALRDTTAMTDERISMMMVDVLVGPFDVGPAREVLMGRRRKRRPLFTYLFIVTAIIVALSSMIFIARWFLTGSPLPR